MTGAHREHTPIVRIDRWAAGGDGIGHLDDGRVVFVRGAVPGDEVRVQLRTVKRDFAKADVAEVMTPSPNRVEPPCPEMAKGCGGCGWQHVAPSNQLDAKTAIVVDALRRTAKLPDALVATGGAVPAWGYRSSMRLAVDVQGRVGLRAGSSHRVVPLDECPVAHPSLSALLPELRVRGADELSLRVGVKTGEITAWASSVQARIDGLPAHAAVGPDAMLHEEVAGVLLRVAAPSFFQSGPAAAELLVRTVREACGEASTAAPTLDAYGGVGLFSACLPLHDVVLVESSVSACADAEHNLPRALVRQMPFERWTPTSVALAVVDPARAGLGAEGAAVLAATGTPRVVLVSCDPVSLARDSTLMAAHGYEHRGSTVLDLFPNTHHVEVVTVFDRR
jgi:23S rRNA (uracil1939-C5)-methyltransferase